MYVSLLDYSAQIIFDEWFWIRYLMWICPWTHTHNCIPFTIIYNLLDICYILKTSTPCLILTCEMIMSYSQRGVVLWWNLWKSLHTYHAFSLYTTKPHLQQKFLEPSSLLLRKVLLICHYCYPGINISQIALTIASQWFF